jgi:phosphate transport system permease protein
MTIDLRKKPRAGESAISVALFLCALVSILTTAGIVFTLLEESIPFFREVGLLEFFTGTRWQPQIDEFGILPLLSATLMTSAIAMLIALPAGLAVAIYLSEYAPDRLRSILKPILEILAGIPTVVYGFFALSTVTPALQGIFGTENMDVYNTLSAGLVMGVLILPLVASLCEDALSSVPNSLREAACAMGATKLEMTLQVVVPAAVSGLAAAFILALSRAVGETMIVALASGAGPALTANPLRAAETMTGHIVRISGGDLSYDTIDYNSLFAIALLLFVITLGLNILSRRIVRKYQEVYE